MEDVVFRVYTPGQPAFRLRPGEEGLSVLDPNLVDPPLTEAEVLEGFRPESRVWSIPVGSIEARRLVLIRRPGASVLPLRLRASYMEIGAGPDMSRKRFKGMLKELG